MTDMNGHRKNSFSGRTWLYIFLGWSLWAGFMFVFFSIRNRLNKQPDYFWHSLFSYQFVWLPWVFVTPLIVYLGKRFPIEKGKLLKNIATHILIALVIVPLQITATTFLDPIPGYVSGMWTFKDWWSDFNAINAYFSFRFPMGMACYAGVLGASYAINYYKKYRERELAASRLETQLARTRLDALRQQLQPHFLFNTLHSIVSLIRDKQSEHAISMAVGLSDLLRRTLDGSKRHEVVLRDEVSFTEKYLEIEQTRFHDRLTVSIEIQPDAGEAYVPSLLLQPIVENALRHGIAKREGASRISITAQRKDAFLHIVISDDGGGIVEEQSQSTRSGFGLGITRERLTAMYGDNFRLELNNNDDRGARVLLTLPYRLTPVLELVEEDDE